VAQFYNTLSPSTALGFILAGTTPGDGVMPLTYTQRDYSGSLNLSGVSLVLTHLPTGPTAGDTFTIIHAAGGVTGTFAGLPEGATVTAPDGSQFTISYRANGGSDVTLTAITPPGFSYDAASGTLTINTGGAPFNFSQGSVVDSFGMLHMTYDFALNGQTIAYPDTQLARVVVNGQGSNSAVLATNDRYLGTDGQLYETEESITLGAGGGAVQKVSAAGAASNFLTLSGFTTVVADAGHADPGLIVGTAGMPNTFVGAGGYAYMNSGSAFYDISGAQYVYGLVANAYDVAYEYDGSGPSTLVTSGVAYSFMIGTDQGQSFFNEAVGFRQNNGVARHPGQDSAIFYDSPMNDVFTGGPTLSYLYSDDAKGTLQEFDSAQGFALVEAYSFVGGIDEAYNYDPNHVHTNGFIRLN
jgi:hypothetical protein